MLREVYNNPTISVRKIVAKTGMSKSIVHRQIKNEDLHPFQYQKVQDILENDKILRKNFCEWVIGQQIQDFWFPKKISFTDEAAFTRDGCMNLHNTTHIFGHQAILT